MTSQWRALAAADGVVDDGSWVRPLALADQLDLGALGPDLQLLGGGGAEGIGGAEEDLLPLLLQLVGQLADRRRLADAVDADHQNDRRLGLEVQI